MTIEGLTPNTEQHELNNPVIFCFISFCSMVFYDNRDKLDESGLMCLDQIHLMKISNTEFSKDMLYTLYLFSSNVGIMTKMYLGSTLSTKQALH